jgi:hypothetical protein
MISHLHILTIRRGLNDRIDIMRGTWFRSPRIINVQRDNGTTDVRYGIIKLTQNTMNGYQFFDDTGHK